MDALRLLIFINSSRGAKKKVYVCVCMFVPDCSLCYRMSLDMATSSRPQISSRFLFFFIFSDPKPKYTWDITERRKKKRERQRQTAAYQGQ